MTAPTAPPLPSPRGAVATLLLLAVVTLASVVITHWLSEAPIAANREHYQQQLLKQLVPPQTASIVALDEATSWQAIGPNGQRLATVHAGKAMGYGGAIRLLVAFTPEGRIVAVRVLEHHETPGLGDKIERRKSPWVDQFEERHQDALALTPSGPIEAMTGATITSEAVIRAVVAATPAAPSATTSPRETPDE